MSCASRSIHDRPWAQGLARAALGEPGGRGDARRVPYRGVSACTTPWRRLRRTLSGSCGKPKLRNRRVDRVQPQGEICRKHDGRVLFRRIERIRHGALCRGLLGSPLVCTGRTLVNCHSWPNRLSKYPLSHFTGLEVQAPSRPLVIASGPLPVRNLLVQPRPCSSRWRPRDSGEPCSTRPRWRRHVLCRRCGRPRSRATVSSSFMAMRPNVSRMCPAEASGSG